MLEQQYAPDELHEIMMRGMSWIARGPAPAGAYSASSIQAA